MKRFLRKLKRNKMVFLAGAGALMLMMVIPQTEGMVGKAKWAIRNMVGLKKN
ncbi:MAG: hypothetical protein ACOCRX_05635 [Candidatus Woesearchaeota archaeon]